MKFNTEFAIICPYWRKGIGRPGSKSCIVLVPLLPAITKIINLSLTSGQFAEEWKCALINPLLKKLGLDLLFSNYRPVSNLQYISKLTEKAVFNQMHAHMTTNAIYPELQSSYRRFHSTETALLKVTNDILMRMNSQEVTIFGHAGSECRIRYGKS